MTDDFELSPAQRLIKSAMPIAIGLVVLVGLAWLIWNMAHDHATVQHEAPAVPVVALQPPPPPPPPPPPKEQPPEPEKIQTETPTPAPTAPPKAAAPANLTISGPAQAGGDAFGIGAGKGGGGVVGGTGDGGTGGTGGGFAESAYYRYASAFIQQAVQGDDRVTRSVFSLDVRLWIDGAGKITAASIQKSSGDARLDKQVIGVLEAMRRLEEPPPATMKFPLRVTIRGRRA